jgi:cytochrome c oxidase cbb3-type subunit 2
MYDHPFQWGSKRTGPDLARVGGRYSDEWHRDHLKNPRDVVPESIMPAYGFLAEKPLNAGDMRAHLKALRGVGVPYTDKDIEQANADLTLQATQDGDDADLKARYPKSQVRDYDGNPAMVSELDALVAYLQMLGTLVDFKAAEAQEQPK